MAGQESRDLKRLKDEQQVRQRPAPIFGTNDEIGACNAINEIIANSIDEAREGYGNKVDIKVEEDNIITISDDGRGIPMDWNEEEKMYNWELALCTLYSSGKYDDAQYSQALGLNGLGLTATQYASSFMDVYSTYGGKTYTMHFKEGKPTSQLEITKPIREGTGTTIRFQPDPKVFPALKKVKIPLDYFLESLRRQAMIVEGLHISIDHFELEKPVELYFEKGIVDFLDSIIERKMIAETPYFEDKESGTDDPELNPVKYELKMRMAINFSREASFVEVYHNSSPMTEGGVTVDGLKLAITNAFNDEAHANSKMPRADKFMYRDIESMLYCIACTDAPGNRTYFKNQTKKAINNPFIKQAFTQFVYDKVRFWCMNNKVEADKIIAEAIVNKTAREEADKVSKKVIRTLGKAVSFNNKPKNFRDCSSTNVFERELYIVEGLSALTSTKLACDPKFQGIMPIRGKTINCLKEKLTSVLSSDIIIDLYRVLGCGLEVKTDLIENLPQFDMSKLRWNKIIICTDADVDGYHIRCLLLTMFYVLTPSLLKAGKVYIAETPLYEIIYKDQIQFAYDENEKEDIVNKLINIGAAKNKIIINRSKGLGENDPEMMAKSTMNPATRRLIRVQYPEDDSALRDYFNALLGDDIVSRRELIDEYFDVIKHPSAE